MQKGHDKELYGESQGKVYPCYAVKEGDIFVTFCPLCPSDQLSLVINEAKKIMRCRQCGGTLKVVAKDALMPTEPEIEKKKKAARERTQKKREYKPSIQPAESRKRETGGRLDKAWPYVDEQGKLLFETCKYLKPDGVKYFRQRQPDKTKKDAWLWNLKGVRRVLYRLPELRKSKLILIVEGEKDVDLAYSLGFAATCNPMGALKWRPEYSVFLSGKDVVLIPDLASEGLEHMRRVARAIRKPANSIRWLELPGKIYEGYDLSDWHENSDKKRAKPALKDLIEKAPDYDFQKIELGEGFELPKSVLPAQDFLVFESPEKETLMGTWLMEKQIILVTGPRGVGKTWLALSWLDAITRAKNFATWETVKPIPCLYLDGEMAKQDLAERLLGLNPDQERETPLYIYSADVANQIGARRPLLHDKQWQGEMEGKLIELNVKLWVVDNLTSVTSGIDENLKQDWDPINDWLLNLRFQGISTILVHHLGKSGLQRGTSSREDNIDISIDLSNPAGYMPMEGLKIILTFTKARLSMADLETVSDLQLELIEDEKGLMIWTYGSVKGKMKQRIIEMTSEGMSGSAIAEALGTDRYYVSRVKREAIAAKKMKKDGSLTQLGFESIEKG